MKYENESLVVRSAWDSIPIRTAPRLWSANFSEENPPRVTRFPVNDFKNVELRREDGRMESRSKSFTYEAGRQPNMERLECGLVCSGGLLGHAPTASVFRFQLQANGSHSGGHEGHSLREMPGFQAIYTFDSTCPSGASSFSWLIEHGVSEVSSGKAERFVHFVVGKLVNGSWHNILNSNQIFPSHNPIMDFPSTWSPNSSFPISPGENLRFFFDFRVHHWDNNPPWRGGNLVTIEQAFS